MADVNCWLVALAFLLGLVLTFASTVRRAPGDAVVSAPGGTGPEAEETGAESAQAD